MLRGGVLQSTLVHERRARLVARAELALHEARVPVPHPAAVLALAHVLLEPREIGRAGPVRVVRGDRVGDLVERPEAVLEVLAHERADAHGAVLLDLRRHVDEHQPARDRLVGVGADRDHRRDAAERRADEHRRLRAARGRSRGRRRRRPRARSRRRRASRSPRGRAGRRGRRATPLGEHPRGRCPTRSGSARHRAAARPAGRRDRRTRRRASRNPSRPARSIERTSSVLVIGSASSETVGMALLRTSLYGMSRSAAHSRGMPSTRSAMRLRWISLLPPARLVAWRSRKSSPAPRPDRLGPDRPRERVGPGELEADGRSCARPTWR